MSKFYNPSEYDVIGFGSNRRYVRITDEEKRKRKEKLKPKNKRKEHFRKNWDKDLWD
jgi:hypothetical protein